MKELINQQSINDLKKSRKYIYWGIAIVLLVVVALSVPLFLFATRFNRYVMNFLLAILFSFGGLTILYLCVVSLIPLNNYIKISTMASSSNKFSTKGEVIYISDKITHYKGVAVKEIKVKDLEEENKEYIFYVEQNNQEEFIPSKIYLFITYQSMITSYEETI